MSCYAPSPACRSLLSAESSERTTPDEGDARKTRRMAQSSAGDSGDDDATPQPVVTSQRMISRLREMCRESDLPEVSCFC